MSEPSFSEPERKKPANFYNWRELFPELQLIYENMPVIIEEAKEIRKWVPWPEDHFNLSNDPENAKEWTVFPLVYTFPAYDDRKKSWVNSTCQICPKTAELLRQIPNVRTGLFSKLGAGTKLSSHTGWADLANYVLRCHICLDIPKEEPNLCGLLVDGEVQYHKQGSIIVFDDSKPHRAFNDSLYADRVVLIIDMVRPSHLPVGTATGKHTEELDSFVSMFR